MPHYDFRVSEQGWCPSFFDDTSWAQYQNGVGWVGQDDLTAIVEIGASIPAGEPYLLKLTLVLSVADPEFGITLYTYFPDYSCADAYENFLGDGADIVRGFPAGVNEVTFAIASSGLVGGLDILAESSISENVVVVQQIELFSIGEGQVATVNTFQITDYSNEKSSFGVTSITATAGNLAAQQTLAADLAAAVVDLTIGEVTKQQMALVILDTPAIPTSPYAQRELKWLVQYIGDASGKIFSTEIAAPNITDNVAANTDIADLTSTDWAAFVTAFEAFVRSPDNGTETVTVLGARVVGRNI